MQPFFEIGYFCSKQFTMEHSAFINIDLLSQEARKELETFYEFLLFKNKKKRLCKLSLKKNGSLIFYRTQ
jgi:hypothetical protein